MSGRPHAAATRRAARRIATGAILLVLAAGCRGSGPPRIEVSAAGGIGSGAPSAVAAAGTPVAAVAAGDAVEGRWRIRSVGDRALLLHGVALDCGCQVATALPDSLRVGEEATLAVACRAPLAGGAAARSVRLFSSDPVDPEVTLRLDMAVTGSGTEPSGLYFGYVPAGGAAVRRLVLPLRAGGAGASPLPRPDVAEITVTAAAPEPDGRAAVAVRYTPSAPGPLRANLDLGEGRAVPLRGAAFRSIMPVPAEITLPHPTIAGGAPMLVLTSIREEPLAITRIELPPALAGELQGVVPGRAFRLALRQRGPAAPGDAIRIHTDAPDESLVVVPVRPAS